MNKHHKLTMSKARYPGNLRIIECHQCAYALAAEVDDRDVVQMETKVKINSGDPAASHTYLDRWRVKP